MKEEQALNKSKLQRETADAQEERNAKIKRQNSLSTTAKAQAAIEKQHALESAALKQPKSVMSLVEEAESSAASPMSAEALAKRHAAEESADRNEANQQLHAITQKVREEIQAKKEKGLELDEQDGLAIADERAKQAKLQTDERIQMETAGYDNDKLAKMEAAARRFRLAKSKIISASNKKKVRVTEEKNKVYQEATQTWEKEKQRARSIEVDAFRGIEEQQAAKLKKAKDEHTAAITAAAADRAANKKAAQEAKVRAFAAASETAARAKAAATQAKAAAVQALAAERAAADAQIKPAIVIGGK